MKNNILIAYFSRTGGNYINDKIVDIKKGNTEICAEILKDLTDADLFKIEPLKPYSDVYALCLSESQHDLKDNARPELKTYLDSIDPYDTIILAYPNYWGTAPVHVFTFLEHYDFTGKTIMLLCTNEGGKLGMSPRDIANTCRYSNILQGLSVTGSNSAESKPLIEKWLKDNNIL